MGFEKESEYQTIISQLEFELQQQRGMLWLLGEIMKQSVNIVSFKQLMATVTDMLMGVVGVTTCYLSMYHDEYVKVYFRSVELQNEFRDLKTNEIPSYIANIKATYTFPQEEIVSPLIDCIEVPGSRLAIPLHNFNDDDKFGTLVLEHKEPYFFTDNMRAFFETLTIFIASNAQNTRLLQSVSKESQTDALTGSYNRRYLEKALKKITKKDNPVSIAVIDTDNFKTINDVLGHLKGDTVLKAIAQLAKGCLKDYDGELVRYGGDEFLMLIPLPLDQAIHIMEDFRRSVYYIQVTYDIDLPITVTLGACAYPEMVSDPQKAVKAADIALLRGKTLGKNKIVIATEEDIKKSYND